MSNRISAIVAFVLLGATLVDSSVIANSGWDLFPTPLMRLEEAGIPRDAKKISKVLADATQPPKLRYWAAIALAQLEARDYLPLIIQTLDDPVLLAQRGAMAALVHLPTEDAVAPLCAKSSSGSNRKIRFMAMAALFSVKSLSSTKCIVQSATNVNENHEIRWQTLYHLWKIREPSSAYDDLVPTLNDDNPTFRALAAMSLSKRHESDELTMDSLRIREALGTALLDHEIDMYTFNKAIERFEQLTDTEIMLHPSTDIEWFNFEKKGRAITDQRIQVWLDSRGYVSPR